MRSRTEMVTTTFIDSEEDQTETEDSEEDWRPDSSRRRRSKSGKSRQNKRKANSSGFGGNRKTKKHDLDQIKEISNSEDDEYETEYAMHSRDDNQKTLSSSFNTEKDELVKSDTFNLYLYRKDLGVDGKWKENSHLCLWRRDGSNLLQKYIRVKTNNMEDFVFTSSSVYSSWDQKRRKEFATIHVKCMEENNRRVTLLDPSVLKALADKEASRKNRFSAQKPKTYEESSNEKAESQDNDEVEDEEEDDSIENESDEEKEVEDSQSDN